MPLNDLPKRNQDSYGDASMRRRLPQNSRQSHNKDFSDRQAKRRKRNTLNSKAPLFKRQSFLYRINSRTRTYIVIGLAIIAALLMVFIVSSCVRGCTNEATSKVETNSVDSRVAVGTSEELTKALAAKLDQNKNLAWIAEHADRYNDKSLIELALAHPEAIDFVANYPDSDGKAKTYDDSLTKGTAPQLYTWDSRWGGVSYAGSVIATKGSGPTALSMAYMGLTGKNNWTPADIAGAVETAKAADTDSGMNRSFLEKNLANLGLTAESYNISANNITSLLDAETFLLVEVKGNKLSLDGAHWILVTSKNDDGTVNVHDPLSPEVSSRPWAAETIASAANTLYTVTVKAAE